MLYSTGEYYKFREEPKICTTEKASEYKQTVKFPLFLICTNMIILELISLLWALMNI